MAEEELKGTEESNRIRKYKSVISNRQNLTVILENVHDPHNIGAVVRSCDAVGISEIFIVYSIGSHDSISKKVGKNTSSGARKWIKTHYFTDLQTCFTEVRLRYDKIYGTHLSTDSESLYGLDLTQPLALMFGNEHLGISKEALRLLDGNFIIPQYGMVQSLNISVACAVSLFEAARQREVKNMYDKTFDEQSEAHQTMLDWFVEKHIDYIRKKEK
jgi:tRNA (guanosine-2'-O-)-methyltransferase